MNLPTRLSISCFCGLAALFCSIAQAQTCPFTFSHNADSLTHTCTEITTGVFDLKITVTDDGSPTVAVIVNDLPGGGPPAIRDLVFELIGPSGTGPHLTATVAGPAGDPENLAGLSSVSVETSTGGELYLEEMIVAGNLGSIAVHRLESLRVLGDVTGDITILEIVGFFSGRIGIADIDGDLLGSIRFDIHDGESVMGVLSVDGDIGSVTSPVLIHVGKSIGLISCNNLYGDVYTEYAGILRRLETRGLLEGDVHSARIKVAEGVGGSGDPGVFIGSGDYKDTLACTIELAGDIDIPGNIGDEATVQVASIPSGYSVSVGGDVEAGGEVQVLGDLAGSLDVTGDIGGTVTIYDNLSGTITCDSAGLAAQILVNQQNGSAEWSGDVVVGSTTLGPGETGDYEAPYYGVLSSTLGGGAVGLVPFMYHAKDSAP
ncbi:MAG: hypothetical protein DYG94_02675, partial [Leptolyngbya sp. PLA3]|nr:hypothetical protein [Leptolyngbya sp. PL-A3]